MNRYTCKRPEWSDENTDHCDCDYPGTDIFDEAVEELCQECRWWQPEEEY